MEQQRHKTVLGRYGLIISAFLVFALGLSFAFQNLFEQKRLIEKESRINVWFLAQIEIEYLRLLEALDRYIIEDAGVDKDALMLRFEILWSRLPVLLDGDQTEALRAVPGFTETVSDLLEVLRTLEPLLAEMAQGDRDGFFTIRGMLEPWEKPLHHLVLDALTYESTATSADRKSAERLYYEMLAFSLATYVGIVVLFLALYREIRKTRIAEGEASAARAQLIEAIESISEGFVLFDDQDRVVLYNSKYKEFHPGLADVVKVGARFEDLMRAAADRGAVPVPPSEVDVWLRTCVQAHREPGAPFDSQLSDGRWLKISERKTKHGWIVGVHTDITELKRREVELGRKSALLEATLENINQGICVFDGGLRLVIWNKLYTNMFGFPNELVSIGRPHIDLIRYSAQQGEYGPGEPSEEVVRHDTAIAEAVASGKVRRKRIERGRPNGTTLEFTYNAMPGGGFVATYTDISERIRAEEERVRLTNQFHAAQEENLRLLMERESAQRRSAESRLIAAVESSSEAIILLDSEQRIVIANSQTNQLLPDIAGSIVPGAAFPDLLKQAEARGVFAYTPRDAEHNEVSRVAGPGARPTVTEKRLADGRWLRVSRSATQEGGAVIIWSDITEMKQREEKLRLAKEQAEAANASKTNFLTGMSHELRTPLNAIIGFSEIIASEMFGSVDPQYRGYAQDILRSGHHLLDVITDILDFAKSEEGRLQLHLDAVDAAAVIATCRKIMHDHCEKTGIALRVEAPTDLPRIQADVAKLRQILLNLLSNAVKFTPPGGEITLSASPGADGGLDIRIADTGIGMRPEDIPIALQPFRQVDSSLARKYEGTGLGLPLTKTLVELHGGSLWIESEPGKGTTVRIHLPRAPVAAPGDGATNREGGPDSIEDPPAQARAAQRFPWTR
ncbi:MAG: PAS-domain containing protein [Kiloniellaceae bacterium]